MINAINATTFKAYATERTNYSFDNFGLTSDTKGLATISFGLVEELGETIEAIEELQNLARFQDKITLETKTAIEKEIGDVLCYLAIQVELLDFSIAELDAILCLNRAHIEDIDDLRYGIFNYYEINVWKKLANTTLKSTLGLHKRLFRGDVKRNKLITNYMEIYSLLSILVKFLGTNFEEIMGLNAKKLSDRKENKTLIGEGSNR